MSLIDQAWENTKAVKRSLAGVLEPGETIERTAAAGEKWIRGLFGAWGLEAADVDKAGEAQMEVAMATIERLAEHRDDLEPEAMLAIMHASGFSNGLALGLEIARLQLALETDPRELGGDIAGPGGPFDFGAVVIDASKAIIADELDIAKVDKEGARGQEAYAVLAAGRINQTADRAKVMLLGDLDWLAAMITEAHGVAERDGQQARLHRLCQDRWNRMPHPENGSAQR